MRVAFIIVLAAFMNLGAGQASAQNAYLEKGQSGTAVGLAYQRGNHTTVIGLGVGLATEGTSDVSLAVYTSSRARTTAYGAGVGITFLQSSENSGVISGLPLTIEYLDPPGRERSIITGSAGLSFDVPYNTGKGTHFVFSLGGSIAYVFTAHNIPADRTIEIAQMSMGQSINTGNGNFWLLSVVAGYSTASPNHGFIGFEIGFLFPDK